LTEEDTKRSFNPIGIEYADGSETNKGTGAGLCGYGIRQKLIYSLGKYTTVFQVEVCTIKACAVNALDRNYKIETSTFSLTVKLQLKHLTIIRSTQNCFGTAINPS
jgi:hypothetical protein